ncbi:MAG: hypothetical protein Q8Q07_02035 [Dehalococcoidales bacterium]|nr:hypothetical protein [Dehalococcoidales bacterium]
MGNETQIEGYFDISLFTKAFSIFWLSVAFLFFLVGIIIIVPSEGGIRIENLGFVIVPFMMMILGALACRYGIWIGEQTQKYVIIWIGEQTQKYVIDFIERKLDAIQNNREAVERD